MEFDFQALVETFLADAQENLASMENALVALESQPWDGELRDVLFRCTHSLKGDAACVGFDHVSTVAHTLENLLERLRNRTIDVSPALITLLLAAVDALRGLVADAAAGNTTTPDRYAGLLAEIMRVAGSETTGDDPMAGPGDVSSAEIRLADLHCLTGGHAAEPGTRAAEPGAPAGDAGLSRRGRTLRVNTETMDRMLNLTGEILVSRGRARRLLDMLDGPAGEAVRDFEREADRLYSELQELVMQVRMVPVGSVFRQHIRTVRDLAASHGKVARLSIEGGDVEVDTSVVEELRDPLIHLIRNAMDHGIEPPHVRQARGKDPCGVITLSARHRAGNIIIEVSDDGAGLDRRAIAERAVAAGLIADPQSLDDNQIANLVFAPGFSTTRQVTELSGRGVGLDIVHSRVHALRGAITIAGEVGQGTTVTIRLPLTLAIMDGFEIGVGSEAYIIPVDSIIECVELPAAAVGRAQGVIDLRGRALPFVHLRPMLGQGSDSPDGTPEPSNSHRDSSGRTAAGTGKASAGRGSVVVVRHEDELVGLGVDALRGQTQTVIKPLGELFSRAPGVAGSAILGSGRVALILDVPGILDTILQRSSSACSAPG